MISIIVASDPNGIIGKGNTIPWYLPADLKFFKQRTMGSSIVMGRLTWDSLPKKPLLGRVNYVISRSDAHPTCHSCLAESLAGPLWFHSLQEAIEDAKLNKQDDGTQKQIYIIGGEQIYKLALELNLVDQIILTRISTCYEGDHYFNIPPNWVLWDKEDHDGFSILRYGKV